MEKIDNYWASFFGLSIADFTKSGLKVVPHVQLQNYNGAWLFKHNHSGIISVPANWVEKITLQLHQTTGILTDADFVGLFGESVEKIVGLAYHGCLEQANFRAVPSSARILSEADDTALRRLLTNCDEDEVESSTIQVGAYPNFGCFEGNSLVAASNYRVVNNTAAMPGVLTHQECRGQDYGRAVLSCAVEHALKMGLLMVCQTLIANKSAIAAAECLGYQQYATHLALRFR